MVEDYGVVESGDVNGMVALLESDKDALQGLSAPDVALPLRRVVVIVQRYDYRVALVDADAYLLAAYVARIGGQRS